METIKGSIKGIHRQDDLRDILTKLKSGISAEDIASYYDRKVAAIRRFALENGVTPAEPAYYETVDSVVENLSQRFYSIDDEGTKVVIQRLLDGDLPASIAKDFSVSPASISNFARANRIKPRAGTRGRRPVSSYDTDTINRIVTMRTSGKNAAEIASAEKIPYTSVVKLLQKHGTTAAKKATSLPHDKIKGWIEAGWSQTRIAVELGVPLYKVQQTCKSLGLTKARKPAAV